MQPLKSIFADNMKHLGTTLEEQIKKKSTTYGMVKTRTRSRNY